jgi:hypothetical protein
MMGVESLRRAKGGIKDLPDGKSCGEACEVVYACADDGVRATETVEIHPDPSAELSSSQSSAAHITASLNSYY